MVYQQQFTLNLTFFSFLFFFARRDLFIIGSNNYKETYTTKRAVYEVRMYASQSTYYYIQQKLQYATYRKKKRLKLTASGVTLGYKDRHYRE